MAAKTMKKETAALLGSLGASFLVASCCLAPTVFVLFGVSVGALGWFTPLEPYRPWFIAGGAAALSLAGWWAWRDDKSEDCDEACAPDGASKRKTKRFVIGASVIYAVALAYPVVLERLL